VISQGGHIDFLTSKYDYQKGDQSFAVDCQTWGLLTLGQEKFDKAYKYGRAYQVWQATKNLSGYFVNGKLGGVGYTTSNVTHRGQALKIWSGEWTWGAIFMCKRIGNEYLKKEPAWGQDMLNDAKSMIDEMSKDAKVDVDGVWNGSGLVQVDGSYLYANERFFIPWGWYANPVGATSSTGWAVFNDYDYNPFELGGGPTTTFYKEQCKDNPPEKDILQKLAKYYNHQFNTTATYKHFWR